MSTDTQYTRLIGSRFPGLFVILIDQSKSMREEVLGTGGATKAEFAATELNSLIFTMGANAGTDEFTGKPKNRAYVSILGYGHEVCDLLSDRDLSSQSAAAVSIPSLIEKKLGDAQMVGDTGIAL